MSELLDCPFCGRKARVYNIRTDYVCGCEVCEMRPVIRTKLKRHAIDFWNRRADLAHPKTSANEKLKKALELVLDTVSSCHDCWNLSGNDKNIKFVEEVLSSLPEDEKEGVDFEIARLKKVIAEAAVCVFEGKTGINGTIWMGDGKPTLYEHLVSELDVDLSGEFDHDLEQLKSCANYTLTKKGEI